MGIRTVIKKIMNDFFVITTGILIGVIVYGWLFEPNITFDLHALLGIVFSGLLTSVPTLIFYSGKELSRKQMLIRQILHFILLETIILSGAYASRRIKPGDAAQTITLFLLVFIIYAAVRVREWLFDKREAGRLNKSIREYNSRSAS